jgi:penicillin-binding protein 1A
VERPVPTGLTQVDGEWLYDEFTGDAALHSLDVDEAQPPGDAPAGTDPATAPATGGAPAAPAGGTPPAPPKGQ